VVPAAVLGTAVFRLSGQIGLKVVPKIRYRGKTVIPDDSARDWGARAGRSSVRVLRAGVDGGLAGPGVVAGASAGAGRGPAPQAGPAAPGRRRYLPSAPRGSPPHRAHPDTSAGQCPVQDASSHNEGSRVRQILCARDFCCPVPDFTRCLFFALSDAVVPGLRPGLTESGLPCRSELILRVPVSPFRAPLTDPPGIALRPFPSVT
jgi:hypothetical protein